MIDCECIHCLIAYLIVLSESPCSIADNRTKTFELEMEAILDMKWYVLSFDLKIKKYLFD
jgi:hypothetical protein